jgi:hypothetical protein
MGDRDQPEVLCCYFDHAFEPALAAMAVRWPDDGERVWRLPEGVVQFGPPPERFGLRLWRTETDAYSVFLLWNGVRLKWEGLTRAQLMLSCLPRLLRDLGTNFPHLLDQPVCPATTQLPRVA